MRVLDGGCVPLGEEGVPLAPLVEALRGLADQLEPAELAGVTTLPTGWSPPMSWRRSIVGGHPELTPTPPQG
jgi:hypothetical protein